jgi:ubiquinone/menaquinone biosynthesis C-methylase UbiE
MMQALEPHPSVAVYTPARLAFYDLFILGLSCSFVWRCPRRHFLDLYDQHVGSRHLDIGVGTGYFLDRCRFPIERPQITLLDPSDACLTKAARRLERYSPRVVKASALEPLELGTARFASVALNGVLHCLPATPETKAAVFENLKPFLENGGVVFGSTILGSGVEHGRLARRALAHFNRERFFTNLVDDLGGLNSALAHNFADQHIDVRGSFALFAAHA